MKRQECVNANNKGSINDLESLASKMTKGWEQKAPLGGDEALA